MIDAHEGDRLQVHAGPGTGKTATACGRVASLIDRDVPPTRILLLSFTRTAVAELRQRIASFLRDPSRAWLVRIATLDSEAWRLCNGFSEQDAKKLFGDYEQNIAEATKLLARKDDLVDEHMQGYQHVVIDEAQDILGARADLVLTLLRRLSKSCGVTVFGDAAQSIYGFASDTEDAVDATDSALFNRLKDVPGAPFAQRELAEVHRTASTNLLEVFTKLRRRVLVGAGTPAEWKAVRDAIEARADGRVQEIENEPVDQRGSVLALYRRRAEVLQASAALSAEGVAHRLRLSQTQTVIHPWIGWVLGECSERRLTAAAFERLWAQRFESAIMTPEAVRDGWQLLCSIAQDKRDVDLVALRECLSRRSPPLEACVIDGGNEGPTLGTIHASKGREADDVLLYLPSNPPGEGAHINEEARVLFVGATRARRRLLVGAAGQPWGDRYLPSSGRSFRPASRGKQGRPAAFVELGRAEDVDLASVVHREVVSEQSASGVQRWLVRAARRIEPLQARLCQQGVWRFVLSASSDETRRPLGALSKQVLDDMNEIARTLDGARLRVPPQFGRFWMHGCTTVAIPLESPRLSEAVEPYRQSGFFVAPVVRGPAYMQYATKREGEAK